MNQTPHVAILPSLGISHLIPFVELAKRLILHHDLHVTCIIPCTPDDPSDATKSVLESLPKPNSRTIFLPPVSFDDLPDDANPSGKISHTMTHSLPSIHHVLKSLVSSTSTTSPPPVVALFLDPFAIGALDIAKELDIPTYVFFPTNAMALSLFFYLPKLDEIAASYDFMRDLPEPVKLPGCPPFHGGDLFASIQDRRTDTYKRMVQISKLIVSAEVIKGFILNSFVDIEAKVIKALQEKKTIYPVGPIVQTGSPRQDDGDSECLTWLDKQPRGSVLYVSFGSGGTLSYEQMTELAFGLEMSGHRFIWVVRRPNNEFPNAAYLNHGPKNPLEPLDFLPNGFLERRGQGLVVPNWAPQTRVLGHSSTGGFLSHCGWSSTLESTLHGVPIIAWPLFAEQKMNSVLLVENLKVALRPKADGEDGIIRREEVASVVKALMEGTSEKGRIVRHSMKQLKDSVVKALNEDGASTRALSELASTLKNMATKGK